ncbi:helicase HerA domain-containing protein [Rossellomorea vietnamensis]|uniref:helicase HerA domain-containing protein n=1 Tax=Rossellomorea vietnamensis TaxID=218284 RepID=UPI003CECDFAF
MKANEYRTFLEKKAFSKIGKVIEVNGRLITVLVDENKNFSNLFFEGEVFRNVGIGSYIKIEKDFKFIVGKISKEYLKEKKSLINNPNNQQQPLFDRFIEISIIGFFENGVFYKGIKELPFLYNEAFLMSDTEIKKIYKMYADSKSIPIGKALFEDIIVEADISKLFASHIGVFGNTGSGKSNTLARLYHNLFSMEGTNFSKSKFIMLDFNGEYTNSESIIEKKKNITLTTRVDTTEVNKLQISEDWLDEEFWSILLEATARTQKPFIKRSLNLLHSLNQTSKEDTLNHLNNRL